MRSGPRRSLASYGPLTKSPISVVRAGRDRADRRVERIEVVDEALARIAVVLQPLIEALLLEDDAVVDAGDVAARGRFAGADLPMIRLFAARERGEQIVADRADVELVHLPALRGRDQRDQPIAGQPHFLAAVEVVVAGGELRPTADRRRPGRGLPLRRANCRPRSGAGRSRSAGAAGTCRRTRRASRRNCTGRGRARCGPGRRATRSLERPLRSSPFEPCGPVASCSRRLTICIREYISFVSGYFTLKFRQ